jgi:2'-5' RNA ligase
MRLVIHCLLEGPVVEYQRDLIHAIGERFGLPFTGEQALHPHFTLRYEFETADIAPVETLIERFCETQKKTPVEVGGFGEFPPDVAFLNVHLSSEARQVFEEFLRELRGVPWLTWSPYDGENLHFHATVAERCGSKLPEVRAFLRAREQMFSCWFDNITLLVQTGVSDGISRWKIHRRFMMR